MALIDKDDLTLEKQTVKDEANKKQHVKDEKMEARKKRWLYLLFVTAAMLVLTVFSMGDPLRAGGTVAVSGNGSNGIIINEIMAVNYTGLADEDGDTGDWIELYNPGNLPVNLFGYSLSDKQDIPNLWTFPDVKIMPGEYLLVWADGKDRVTNAGIHTNFRISENEVITLSNPSGTVIDSVHLDRIIPDISYGR
ncbi:MAG: lamin tail domain-containing protein, partial [Clostridiaceae bacterium]|nr:lamin tail domain-containing protein [Clostridiaceae bacterium]